MLISKTDGNRILDYIHEEQRNEKEEDAAADKLENEDETSDENKTGAEKKKGKKTPEEIREEKKKRYEEGTLKLLATFNMTSPDNHVEYSLWMSSSNDKALDFIEDFRKYQRRFED